MELAISDPTIAGYAFYEGTTLARAVFINSHAFLKSSTSRGQVQLTLTVPGVTSGTLKRLAIPLVICHGSNFMLADANFRRHADDTSGLTWGGQTYETSDGKVSGTLHTETINLATGFSISDTEAVMISF